MKKKRPLPVWLLQKRMPGIRKNEAESKVAEEKPDKAKADPGGEEKRRFDLGVCMWRGGITRCI